MAGLINADAFHIPLRDKSVHCVVTSPPYYGQRNYDVDGQIGLEQTPYEYVANIVTVFREVWRVLRDDGTVWLNIGDSYAGSNGPGNTVDNKATRGFKKEFEKYASPLTNIQGIKRKSLIGIPWRVVFALQDDGWILRRDVIWHKPNVKPESAKDRPTTAHEYVFMLTKEQDYYFDMEAVLEEYDKPLDRWGGDKLTPSGQSSWDEGTGQQLYRGRNMRPNPRGRHLRSVWSIPTKRYGGAHFATFPPDLVEPCIKASTSEKGCCAVCGEPLVRLINKVGSFQRRWSTSNAEGSPYNKQGSYQNIYETVAWIAVCTCGAPPVPCTVFDPFVGSGTTLLVAHRLGRAGVGTDLSFDYLKQARKRLGLDLPLFFS